MTHRGKKMEKEKGQNSSQLWEKLKWTSLYVIVVPLGEEVG